MPRSHHARRRPRDDKEALRVVTDPDVLKNVGIVGFLAVLLIAGAVLLAQGLF